MDLSRGAPIFFLPAMTKGAKFKNSSVENNFWFLATFQRELLLAKIPKEISKTPVYTVFYARNVISKNCNKLRLLMVSKISRK